MGSYEYTKIYTVWMVWTCAAVSLVHDLLQLKLSVWESLWKLVNMNSPGASLLGTDLFSAHPIMRYLPFFTLVLPLVTVSVASDTMVKHLQSADASRSFSEFRQEASMLHSLQHPCIVSLVGISIHPLCFALQLAPLGSLNTVLEERHKAKGT